ncbi:MAG TPA: hypothetical protein VFO19_04485 [Vicinamibacterales bacterium]|nr:hypothetical protein [Vicinamibacterales bacterium]
MTWIALLMSMLLQPPALAEQAIAPAPPPPPPRELIVVVSIPTYLPDGGVNAETVALPTAGAGLVHAFSRRTLCAPATTGATEPTDAAAGWRIASQIVTRSETSIVVSLDWRRVWDGGRKITAGPGATVQLTLHAGDRIPLDLIANSSPSAECRAVGLGLEVRVARTPPSAPAATTPTMPSGSTPGGAKPVSAELWLTHTSPSDTTQVYRQVVRIAEAGGRFSFAPTSVSTSRGEVDVELTGTIDRFRSPDGAEFFVLSMNRVVSGANLPAAGLSATTGVTVAMPTASEVLSFELTAGGRTRAVAGGGGGAVIAPRGGGAGGSAVSTPPPASAAQGVRRGVGGGGGRGTGNVSPAALAALLEGHQFSLRMRVTPVN